MRVKCKFRMLSPMGRYVGISWDNTYIAIGFGQWEIWFRKQLGEHE